MSEAPGAFARDDLWQKEKLRVIIVDKILTQSTAVGKQFRKAYAADSVRVLELGCSCSVCVADLGAALKRTARRGGDDGRALDLVVVETAGLADPEAVAMVFLDEDISAFARLDGVITSLAIDVPAEVDVCLFQGWVSGLHAAADVFKVQATVAVKDVDDKFAYRACRRPGNGAYAGPWGDDEERGCRVTVIGRNLDHAALRASFDDCLATPANYRRVVKLFRFRLGDTVECFLGGDRDWARGTIVKHLYRDACWHYPPGYLVPYQIKLDDGRLIYCPADHNGLIRKGACRRAGGSRVAVARRRRRAVV